MHFSPWTRQRACPRASSPSVLGVQHLKGLREWAELSEVPRNKDTYKVCSALKMCCSNTVVHWLNTLLFDILLDSSGWSFASDQLSFLSGCLLWWWSNPVCADKPTRQATIGLCLYTSPAFTPCWAARGEAQFHQHPWEHTCAPWGMLTISTEESRAQSQLLLFHTLLLLIYSLSYLCSRQCLPFLCFHATFIKAAIFFSFSNPKADI